MVRIHFPVMHPLRVGALVLAVRYGRRFSVARAAPGCSGTPNAFRADLQIYKEVAKHQATFHDLRRIDEIWVANTSIYESEKWVSFALIDGRGLVELLIFENGALKQRRDDRPKLRLSRP
jgi:hypothetical protein